MTASQVVSYSLAALGCVMIALAVVDVIRRRINVTIANQTVVKLALAGNLERAAKLCAAAPGTYLDAIAAAIDRSNGAADRSAAEIAVHSAFDEVAKPAAARWLTANDRGFVGVITVGGAIALAISSDKLSRPLEVAAGLAGLAGLWLLARRNYYAAALVAVRATVLPAIVDARLGTSSSKPPAQPTDAAPSPVASVRIFRGDQLIETRALSGIVKIGSAPTAHLCLRDDDQVSRLHAILEIEPDRIQIIDLGSNTGTLVNGHKVNKTTLHDGDVIVIGATRLELVRPGSAPQAPVAPASQPMVAPPPQASLASGTCPLCKHAVIKTVQRDDPRFRTLVCASCGYAQEFANLDALS